MAIIKCPACGAERVVPEGKIKRCRKCGEKLTTIKAPPPKPPEMTADELAAAYPRQVQELIERAEAAGRREPAKPEPSLPEKQPAKPKGKKGAGKGGRRK